MTPERVGRYELVAPLDRKAAGEARPEQLDLYGLGEVLFYLIAGAPAFASTPEVEGLVFAKLRAPANLRAAVPTVTAPTARLVEELTSPDPAARPRTAFEVRDGLEPIS